MVEEVRSGLARYIAEGPEAIVELLDPDAEMLSNAPGPWDCHNRADILRFLRSLEAEGIVPAIVEVTAIGDQVLLGLSRRRPDGHTRTGYSLVSLRDGLVIRMQAYSSREAAAVAAGS